ncbi:MAG: TRAP transporter small permease [Ramlibacter sp.]|nr:TRAP transporter small permease [Ramlibacter sp.]
MKDRFEQWLGTLFGVIYVALSLFVSVEVVMRKVFDASLQGADELGGYALAVGATIAFSLALLGRTHVRIDVFHGLFPRWLGTTLNWISSAGIAAFAALLAYSAWYVIADTFAYKSVAPTPWATPLAVPQTVWLVGLGVFACMAAGHAVRATALLLRGRWKTLDAGYGPRSTQDEICDELEDLEGRAGLAGHDGRPAAEGATPP